MKKKDRQRLLSSLYFRSPWSAVEDRVDLYYSTRAKIWAYLDAAGGIADPLYGLDNDANSLAFLLELEISGSKWKKLYREWRNGK